MTLRTERHNIDDEVERLVLLSDIHGFIQPLHAVDEFLGSARKPYQVIFNGDLVRGGPWPREVIQWISDHAGPLATVGNHDETLMLGGEENASLCTEPGAYHALNEELRKYVGSLPECLDLHWRGHRIVCMHGHHANDGNDVAWITTPLEQANALINRAADLTVASHSHYPYVQPLDGTLVANTGSLSRVLLHVRTADGWHSQSGEADSQSTQDVRGSLLTVDVVNSKLDVQIVRFDFDKEGALADLKRAGETNLDFHRRWLYEGKVEVE